LAVEFGFAPKVVGRFQFSFQLKTLLGPGREFTLPCEGWGKDPALTVDGNVLTLPPTSAREASSGSVFISNHGKCEKTFEIVVPLAAKNRGLTVSPHVATLQPGERKRVRVEFCPPERDADCGDDSSGEGQDEDSSGEGKDEDSSGEGKEDDSGEGNDDDSTEGNEKGNDEKNDSRDDALPEIFRLALFAKNTNFLRDAAGAFESTNDEHPDEHPGDTNRDSHKNQNQPEETRTFAQHLEVRTATHVPAISVLGLPEFLLEETFGETDGRTVRNRLSKDTDGGTSEKTSENTLDETSKTSKETSSKDTVHPPGGVRFKKNRRLDRREKAFVMDFGIVAVGAGGLRRLLVKNETDATVVTKPSCFDHEGTQLGVSQIPPPCFISQLVTVRPYVATYIILTLFFYKHRRFRRARRVSGDWGKPDRSDTDGVPTGTSNAIPRRIRAHHTSRYDSGGFERRGGLFETNAGFGEGRKRRR
jgi:hypothetical protein